MKLGHTFRRALFGAALCSILTVAPAARAQDVHTDYDHNARFENFHTFSFAKVQTDDPLYEQRLREDITADLQKDGLQLVPSGGDLAVTAIGGVHNQQQYNSFYTGLGPGFGWRGWGGWWGGGWGGGLGETNTTVEQIPVGTLMVDLYDTQTHNLVFRGRAQADLKKNEEKNIGLVRKTVDKMFNHFPPKHAA
jgi:hypothetical protein